MRFAGWDRVAAFACGSQLAVLPWDYEPPLPGMYVTLCTYEPALGAWATCVDQVVSEHASTDVEHAETFSTSVDFANVACMKAGGGLAQLSVQQFNESLRNASAYLQNVTDVVGKLSSPVKLLDYSRQRTVRAVRSEFLNLDNSNDSVWWIYYYFAAILLVMFSLQHQRVRALCLQNRVVNKLRAKFELPTMWQTTRHAQSAPWALGGLVPTSLEASLLAGFFIVHTLSLCLNYSVDHEEVLEEVYMQRMQALGNRSGIVSFGLLPLIIIFSTRNNLVQRLTGLRYTSFLVLHRWVGRIITVDVLIHTVAFYFHERLAGVLEVVGPQWWWRAGVIGTWLCGALIFLAMGALRSRWYETFLYLHIVLAIVFFYLCWAHVKSFGWTYWISWSCLLWLAERLLRLYTMSTHGICHADTREENNNLLVLTVPKPPNWREHPTQYAFLYFLLPTVFWQSHPLTLMSTDDNKLKAVISVKSGVTKVLQRTLRTRALNDSSTKIPICLEGPYGHSPVLRGFQKILLVSGGSGIPGPLAMCRSLLGQGYNLHLIIVIRDLGLLNAYREEIIYIIESQEAKIDIHYTGNSIEQNDLITHRSRPDMHQAVGSLTMGSTASAVVCCGPPALNDQVRNLVAAAVEKHPQIPLEYFEEYQVW